MSADLLRTVILHQENDCCEDQETAAVVRGRSDFTLAQWREAFKAQRPEALQDRGGWRTVDAFIDLDLD